MSLESLSFYLAQGDTWWQRKAQALSHVDARGKARMVDVGDKAVTAREALARGEILMSADSAAPDPPRRGRQGRPAADRAAGRHDGGQADVGADPAVPSAAALARRRRPDSDAARLSHRGARADHAQTGVEMEALTAVAVAALTVYDMVKAVDKSMVITDIYLVEKTGGRSGTYRRPSGPDEPVR